MDGTGELQCQQATLKAELSDDRQKIILTTSDPEALAFCRTLPDCRLHPKYGLCCANTPATIWRIVCGKHGLRIDADELMTKEASRIDWLIKEAAQVDESQPTMRIGESWRHQCLAYNFSRRLADAIGGALLGMGMGTGKSRVLINLLVNFRCKTILILCPLSVLAVWRREMWLHAKWTNSVVILDSGSVKKKTALADRHLKFCSQISIPAVVVINYDSARMPEFAAWSLARDWDCVACDESHRIKSHNSATSKYAAKLGRRARYRFCLTGTPLAHSPLDIFGQARFIDPGLFGTGFCWFKDRYTICGIPSIPEAVTAWVNQQELAERMAMFTFRVGAEVLDLPPVIHETRQVTIGREARRIYDDLESEMVADIQGGRVTAANALTRLLRLQQVTSGFVVPDHDLPQDRVEVMIDSAKAKVLTEMLEDLPRDTPIVVGCLFKHDLAAVRHAVDESNREAEAFNRDAIRSGSTLRAKLRRYGEISGAHKDLTATATIPEGIDVLGVQIAAGGLGIDLTRARYAIIYSLGYSLSDYEQFLARLHRPGQRETVVYYHLVATGTVEEHVYDALRKRKDVIEAVLEVFKRRSMA